MFLNMIRWCQRKTELLAGMFLSVVPDNPGEGSGYGGHSGHHVPHTISTPGYSTITSTTTTAAPTTVAPTTVAATATHEGDPADDGRRNRDTFRRHQALRVRQLAESRGHCRRRREMIGGVKPATARWVRWVRKATRSSMRASRTHCAPSTTPPPPPHRRHRKRCPCGESCVRLELSTPGEVSFPRR